MKVPRFQSVGVMALSIFMALFVGLLTSPVSGCLTRYLGDGDCDDINNKWACDYDGGDCCEGSCVDRPEIYERLCGEYADFDCKNSNYHCPLDHQANGVCEPDINTLLCDYDKGDCCEASCTHVGCGDDTGFDCKNKDYLCPDERTADGVCDEKYNSAICDYDKGDCCEASCTHVGCGDDTGFDCKNKDYLCPGQRPADGVCDEKYNSAICEYDQGDCCEASCTHVNCGGDTGFDCKNTDYLCPDERTADGVCDEEYNSAICDYDEGDCCEVSCGDDPDCGTPFEEFKCVDPKYACELPHVQNGICDEDFNSALCGYDAGDCCELTCGSDVKCGEDPPFNCIDPIYACTSPRQADGNCDVKFNSAACDYDCGDCCEATCFSTLGHTCGGDGLEAVFYCRDPKHMCSMDDPRTPDGICDGAFNSAACDYDAGDCCEANCGIDDTCRQRTDFNCIDPDYTCDLGLARNGQCDAKNNVEECDYDGGDCCEGSCYSGPHECGEAGYSCYDPDYSCDTTLMADTTCDAINNVNKCSYDNGACCDCTVIAPRNDPIGLYILSACHDDLERGDACKDPSATCLAGYVEAGDLTSVVVTANAYDKGGLHPNEPFITCGKSGCKPDLTRDYDDILDSSRWSCIPEIVKHDGSVQCHITFTFGAPLDIEYVQVAFLDVAAAIPPPLQVKINGAVVNNNNDGVFEAALTPVYTAFDIGAQDVETVTLTSVGLGPMEPVDLLEVRFLVKCS